MQICSLPWNKSPARIVRLQITLTTNLVKFIKQLV